MTTRSVLKTYLVNERLLEENSMRAQENGGRILTDSLLLGASGFAGPSRSTIGIITDPASSVSNRTCATSFEPREFPLNVHLCAQDTPLLSVGRFVSRVCLRQQ